jgi:putative hemolysin/predicted nucleic acid-binding Zn ribbon protein
MKKSLIFIFSFFAFTIFAPQALGLLNPAERYCTQLGYKYTDEGECLLPNGEKVNAWDFLQGKVGKEYSFCAKNGYEIKTVKDFKQCMKFGLEECAVCILPDKTEKEVTELMGLKLTEGECGDGRCTIGETYENCPKDCPSGSVDAYCDGVKDGICDEDCLYMGLSTKDPDCPVCGNKICESNKKENEENCPEDCSKEAPKKAPNKFSFYLIGGGIIFLIVVALVIFSLKGKKVQK